MSNTSTPANSSLCHPFSPAVTLVNGLPTITGPRIARWTRGLEEDEHQGTLHGELAGLDVKFQVNLNPSYCSNHGTVYLICKLNDKKLPSVPPLQLSISADYPNQSPYWTDDEKQYTANTFLLTVHKLMTSRLHRLPRRYSVTALLNIWDQSVTKASLPAA